MLRYFRPGGWAPFGLHKARRDNVSVRKNPLVPDYIYSARVDSGDVAFFEKAFFDDVEFYPEAYKETPERFEFAKRIGYAYMRQLRTDVEEKALKTQIEEAGDEKFTWRFIPALLDRATAPQFICAGAGVNISFEIALAGRYPMADIVLLDPSPQAINHVRRLNLPKNLRFMEVGLSAADRNLQFYKPSTQGIGSLSALALHPGEESFELPVKKLSTIIDMSGFDASKLKYLKFDVEGSEHEVIGNMIAESIRPEQIAWEFDQPIPPWTMERTLKKICGFGYEIVDVWGLNVLAVERSPLRSLVA